MKRWGSVLIHCVLAGLLLYLLWWRWQVSQSRFFDVDEFTHIHWAAAMARGSKPYIDFFTFFTPGFYWFLRPLFWVFGNSVTLFLAARWVALLIFLGILGSLGYLFGTMRDRRWALLPMILLAFLPMPYDKFLEVRPDNLATLIAMIGVIGEIWAIGGKKNWWFLSGLFYGLSLMVLVKMLPFAAVGIGILLLAWYWKKAAFKDVALFFFGFGMPLLVVGVWALSLGDISRVIYSLTRMPIETNSIGKNAIMEPHLFFFPNASFYGGWGITAALLANHAIWVLGILVGVVSFFTPFIRGEGDRKRVLSEMLMSGIFLLSVAGYVSFFPLKHSQYLIPIAICIAFYAADGLRMILGKAPFLLIFSLLLWQQTMAVNQPKLILTNATQLSELTKLKTIIPKEDRVFDLEGRMIYWKDPYYICCLPMGEFVRYMSRMPPNIADVLEAKKVPYVYQGDSGRLWTLGSDLTYIQAHYVSVPGWGDALWERKQ